MAGCSTRDDLDRLRPRRRVALGDVRAESPTGPADSADQAGGTAMVRRSRSEARRWVGNEDSLTAPWPSCACAVSGQRRVRSASALDVRTRPKVQGPPSTTLVRHDRGAWRPRPVDRGGLRRLLGAALPQTAARRDRALHPANCVPLGLPVLGRGRGGGRAHAVGLCRRIDHQPRRLRPEPKFRVPADGAVPSDPGRARARDDHARRPRGRRAL